MLGELLFNQVCLSDDTVKGIAGLSEDELTELSRFIQGHAVDKDKGVAGMIYGLVIAEFGLRAVGERQPKAAGSEKLEVRGEKSLHDETTQSLDRATGLDEALAGSGKAERKKEKGQQPPSPRLRCSSDATCGKEIYQIVSKAEDYKLALEALDDNSLDALHRFLRVTGAKSPERSAVKQWLSQVVEDRFFRRIENGGVSQ